MRLLLVVTGILFAPVAVRAQRAPEVGYMFPPGGKAGTTIDVRLGGYDWTPDLEFFVLDKRVQLSVQGPPGPILIPGPPYWFGAKGRIVSMPLPREVTARLVIPATVEPGPIHWHAANANGGSSAGTFIVGAGVEIIEDESRQGPQVLAALPITVSGRLLKNEEVDRYRVVATKTGPITCALVARRLGAKFRPNLAVHDSQGKLVADALGRSGLDPCITFAAQAGSAYVISVHDIDFGGDRSYVYRLTITPGPQVVGAVPAAGRRGETREVEFVGFGVASGTAKLESVKRSVTFPAAGATHTYRLETPWGTALPFTIPLSDLSEIIGKPESTTVRPAEPVALTGVLERPDTEDQYAFAWKKGQKWSLALEARRFGSPLDVALIVLSPDGKELARNDDLPDTTDAGLDFNVPADGTYRLVVSDMAGKSGSPAAIYRLVVRQPASDFTLQTPAQRVSVPVGGKTDLAVTVVRKGDFKGPITLAVQGLPPGVSAPPALVIPSDKAALTISLQAAPDAGTGAGLVTIEGSATVGSDVVVRTVRARTTGNLVPRGPDDNQMSTLLVASTLKPRFKGRPVDQDTGRKVHRGSTFPADVLVERLDGFQGEIVLQMAATQSYQMQGITGGDVVVPPGVTQTIYPCFMPEWLETTRTSRMGMIGVARVADPKGKQRYLVNDITGFITMTMEGALLKVSTDDQVRVVPAGQAFDVHVKVARLSKLVEPVRLELRLPDELAGCFKAEPKTIAAGTEDAVFPIAAVKNVLGMHTLTIRGTALQDGKYPVVSEAAVTVEFVSAAKVSAVPNNKR